MVASRHGRKHNTTGTITKSAHGSADEFRVEAHWATLKGDHNTQLPTIELQTAVFYRTTQDFVVYPVTHTSVPLPYDDWIVEMPGRTLQSLGPVVTMRQATSFSYIYVGR